MSESDFVGVPLAELTSAQKAGPLQVYRDQWWIVRDGEALFFRRFGRRKASLSPQCNANRDVTERINTREFGHGDVVFVPWAYVQFEPSDYQ